MGAPILNTAAPPAGVAAAGATAAPNWNDAVAAGLPCAVKLLLEPFVTLVRLPKLVLDTLDVKPGAAKLELEALLAIPGAEPIPANGPGACACAGAPNWNGAGADAVGAPNVPPMAGGGNAILELLLKEALPAPD